MNLSKDLPTPEALRAFLTSLSPGDRARIRRIVEGADFARLRRVVLFMTLDEGARSNQRGEDEDARRLHAQVETLLAALPRLRKSDRRPIVLALGPRNYRALRLALLRAQRRLRRPPKERHRPAQWDREEALSALKKARLTDADARFVIALRQRL